MPVILTAADYELWLDPVFKNIASLSEMLKPFEPSLMRRHPVSTTVNNVQNDDADCASRVDYPSSSPAQSQLLIFPF
jgi:putative SOS response-associated peptidase YedK